MPILLLPVQAAELALLANPQPDAPISIGLPLHVIQRSLALLAQGEPAVWSKPYRIARAKDRAVVGACGFKGAPSAGCVEIGYAIDPDYRRQGMASAAVRALLALAWQDETVSAVIATVNPDNLASTRLVERLGFQCCGDMMDSDGERLKRWQYNRR